MQAGVRNSPYQLSARPHNIRLTASECNGPKVTFLNGLTRGHAGLWCAALPRARQVTRLPLLRIPHARNWPPFDPSLRHSSQPSESQCGRRNFVCGVPGWVLGAGSPTRKECFTHEGRVLERHGSLKAGARSRRRCQNENGGAEMVKAVSIRIAKDGRISPRHGNLPPVDGRRLWECAMACPCISGSGRAPLQVTTPSPPAPPLLNQEGSS